MFQVDERLLEECRAGFAGDVRIHWLLGGAGSGKSTVARELQSTLGATVLDMDARIYGTFHKAFSPSRHPVSCQWSGAADGLSWLLDMTWDEFDSFNRASLPEYLDLLAREIPKLGVAGVAGVAIVDGGVCAPRMLSTVIEPSRIVCMRRSGLDAGALWAEPGDRSAMRDAVMALDTTGAKWERFVEFDENITRTILAECSQVGIPVCSWDESESSADVATRVAETLGLSRRRAAQQG